jgi:uncharacterized protein
VSKNWIETFNSKKFHFIDPRPEEIQIQDISLALARKCRFNSYCRFFYSVAQHSIMCAKFCKNYKLEALLHDAAEAYIGDITRPVKTAFPEIRKIEENIEKAIAAKFNLQYPWPKEIKTIDNILLAVEKRDLFSQDLEWEIQHEYPEKSIKHIPNIKPMSIYKAAYEFLSIFIELRQ